MGSAYLHTRHLSHEKHRECRETRHHEYKYMTHKHTSNDAKHMHAITDEDTLQYESLQMMCQRHETRSQYKLRHPGINSEIWYSPC